MELIKSSIYMNRIKDKKMIQITLDDDFIVQDVKPDIDKIIGDKTWITVDSVKLLEGKVLIKGRLTYKILYVSSEPVEAQNMEGSIPFDEVINVDGIDENDMVSVDYTIEDVSISTINSRKINARALVTFAAIAEDIYEEDAIVDISKEDKIDYIKKPLEVMKLSLNKKDIFRIKEELEVPAGKPNIGNLVWCNTDIRNTQTKLMEDKIGITGELIMFVMYKPEEEHMPLQWFEKIIPFSGEVEVLGVTPNMIPDINVKLIHGEPEVYKDYDGENRLIKTESSIDMDIKVYSEEKMNIITDIYSPYIDYVKNEKEGCFESLLTKNQSRNKMSERVKLDIADNNILQICNASGSIKIDNTEKIENGIYVNGILEVNVVYASSSDKQPINSERLIIPFEYEVEVLGINDDSKYYIRTFIEQLSADMAGSEEIEIRASIMMDVLVVNPIAENIITDIEEKPLDMDKIKNLPGMVVHIVQDGENLWNIAKTFYTTVENIKKINNLQGENIIPGERLLVVKQVAIGGAI